MLDSVRGKIIAKLPTYIVVDVNGVGYGIHIPLSTYTRLKGISSSVEIYTQLYIRDENLQMFGFYSIEEKELFIMLLGVSGVGPRMALGILSALSVEQFSEAIGGEDINTLTAVPGIGRKKAERLLLELKDKIKPVSMKISAGIPRISDETRMNTDAAAALASLGCNAHEAGKAVKSARGNLPKDACIEDIIREALKHL